MKYDQTTSAEGETSKINITKTVWRDQNEAKNFSKRRLLKDTKYWIYCEKKMAVHFLNKYME